MNTIAYIPHGHCYLWQPTLVGLHGLSDGLIAIAYFSIPITLIYFVRRRPDLPYPTIFWLFSAFIISCGLTHLLAIWTLWHPIYWFSGIIKAVTAWISVVTAVSLMPMLSGALALPSMAEIQALNRTLQAEIADRQRAEASLRRYERIVSATQDGICLIDPQGIYQIANDTYLKWHQKSADEVLGQPIVKILGPQIYERKIKPYFERCLAGETLQFELWVNYPDVGPQFMSVSYVPYVERDDQVLGMIVSLRNLTLLEQAKTALQQSEATQRAILEAIPDLLIHLNGEGIRLNLISGGEVTLLDSTRCEPQRSIYDTLPPDLADLRMHYVRRALATGQRQTYEHDIWIDQQLRHEETRVVKLNDQEVLLMVRDITDRKHNEANLRRFERIVSASSDGISLLDRNYVYQIVNDTYLHYNGKRREEIVGHSVSELLGEAVFTELIKPKLDACLAGETIQYEAWFEFTVMGRQFIRVTYSPYREIDGTITGVVAITSNLTNLKQAEQALQNSELRFRGIFDQMYQFIGLLSPDGTLLEANRAALDFGNLSHDEVIGQPFWEIIWWTLSPATQQQLQAAIARAAQGKFVRYEVEIQGGEGQISTIDFSLRPVFDEAGQVVLLIPEGRDISDRIKAEKQLQLQAIVTRNIAEGICMLRADNGVIVYANPKFEQMFGYAAGELIGQHVSVLNYQDDSEAIAQDLMAAIAAKGEHTYRIQNVHKDGTTFWCEATTTVFDHPDYGSVYVAVQQDISDRLQAEKQLQLQAIVTRNIAEGICLVRIDNGIIVYANPKFEQMFGYAPGELDGQHVSIVNYATEEISAEAVNQAIRAQVLANREATYEVHNLKKDGTSFWCQATTSVFEHPDYGSVLVAVQQDISDRKEAQEKIQASLKEKELLLKEIYHRVKNNLQVISSLLNLQSRNLTDAAAQAVIKDSQSRVRAMALVHEKLYQSQDLTRIDLADYARSLVRSLLETYCLSTNEIHTQIAIDACWVDIETALPCGLILTELVSNSLKYAFPDGRQGTITITSTQTSPSRITLVIKDDGIGLPPSTSFQTVSSLGLRLVSNLAKQIRGEVAIAPTTVGAEFQLSFPQQEQS